jgi:hypothetical protein
MSAQLRLAIALVVAGAVGPAPPRAAEPPRAPSTPLVAALHDLARRVPADLTAAPRAVFRPSARATFSGKAARDERGR